MRGMKHTILSVLLFDILLVPAFAIIMASGNIFWIKSAAERVKYPVLFIGCAAFITASAVAFWIIVDAQGGIL